MYGPMGPYRPFVIPCFFYNRAVAVTCLSMTGLLLPRLISMPFLIFRRSTASCCDFSLGSPPLRENSTSLRASPGAGGVLLTCDGSAEHVFC